MVIQWKGFCKSIMNFFIIVKHPQLRPFKTSSTLLKMQILIIARNETNCKLFKVVVWLWNMLTFWIGTQLQIYRRDRYEGKNKENHDRYEGKPKKWHLRSEKGHHSKIVNWDFRWLWSNNWPLLRISRAIVFALISSKLFQGCRMQNTRKRATGQKEGIGTYSIFISFAYSNSIKVF